MNSTFNIDMHCHPATRPFCKSYPGNINSPDTNNKTSIWHYDPPDLRDKIRNIIVTLTKFSQSDFTAISKGNVQVISASIAPIEKGFFTTCLGTKRIFYCITNYITEFGKKKIRFIQENNNYYDELDKEYKFYQQLDGHIYNIDGIEWRYKLTSSYNDIVQNLQDTVKTISVILSIEGAYVFNSHSNYRAQTGQILSNIQTVKNWTHRPLFISLAHHFYNELCGHAQSLPKVTINLINQSHGLNTEITKLGKRIIRKLLDNTENKRIYIDIKHMGRQSRIDYYKMLDTEFQNEDIPVIVSHGALNGYPSVDDFTSPCDENHGKFNGKDINFFDDEIVRITKSNGLFCLQLDDRVIASKCEKRKAKRWYYGKNKKLRLHARLIWNHIQRIAEILDANGLDSWGTIAIGSDFDGMVDPPDGYWTSEYFPRLKRYLLLYAEKYVLTGISSLTNSINNSLSADDIINRIFNVNAMKFLQKYYV